MTTLTEQLRIWQGVYTGSAIDTAKIIESAEAMEARVAHLETELEGVREHAALMDAENRELALKCLRLENPE